MIDAPAPVSIRRAWIAVAGMFALNGALFGIWASRVPAIADRHGLDHGALGLSLLFLAGGAVGSFPLAGRAADRFGAAATTRVLALVYPLALILLPLMPGPVSLAGALFVFGALHGAMDVAMNGWGAEVERRYRRPVMSSFHALFSLGAGLGAFSGYVAAGTEMSILAHFATTAAVATVPAVLLARVSWASPRTASAAGSVFALPSGALLLVGVVAFCASLGEGAMADWSAVFLRDVTGADESTAALGYAAFSAAMVAVRLMGDVAIRWLGVAATARAGGICAAIGAALAVASPGAGAVLAGFAIWFLIVGCRYLAGG